MNTPREIKPELVEIGDTVRVVHKRKNGVVMTLEGVVGKRVDNGPARHMMTVEGSTLFAWGGRHNSPVTVWLLNRKPQEQDELPMNFSEFMANVRQRIA